MTLSAITLISSLAFCGFKIEDTSKQPELIVGSKSAYLMDANSGECIYAMNEEVRLPIASVCKVMTLNLLFDAVDKGHLTFDDSVIVSDTASSMGGSQVFLESGGEYKLGELAKSIIVCSANDSCVAVAETVSGSEGSFVAQMNSFAQTLGCTNTLFSNCTGLPKATQYSCSKDVALMFKYLLTHEAYFEYSKIWLEDFAHPNDRKTVMTNTNKLIRKYSYCDGGKTGFTNEAGFCLAATATKNNLRLISVVLGADSSDDRFKSTVSLFDYGFANYKNMIVLDSQVALNDQIAVYGGKKDEISVVPQRNSYVFTKATEKPEITFRVASQKVKAPVEKGVEVGQIEVYKDGIMIDSIPLLSNESVAKSSYLDDLKDTSKNWNI